VSSTHAKAGPDHTVILLQIVVCHWGL